jgi:hypothetical protein
MDFPLDYSSERFIHLLKRIEFGPEAGYDYFNTNENNLKGQPIKLMSRLTQALLCNIDYENVIITRKRNFLFFQEYLSKTNKLKLPKDLNSVPMVFPYLCANGKRLKQKLIREGIFVATYWPNVLKWCDEGSIEKKFTLNILNLPLDQRYSEYDLRTITELILHNA